MKKFKKTFDLRRGKLNTSYTVEEITELLGITKGTLYRWIKEGLTPLDQQHPYLFQGKTLKDFLKERQRKRKWLCGIDEFPCFKCQRPRRALEGKVRIQLSKQCILNLAANCGLCQSRMFKCVSQKNLTEVLNCFRMEELHNLHIIDCTSPTCNDHSNDADNTFSATTETTFT